MVASIKRVRKTAFGALGAACFLLTSCGAAIGSDYGNGLDNYVELGGSPSSGSGFSEEVAQDGLSLKLNPATCEISLTDLRSDAVWYSNPQEIDQDPNMTVTSKQQFRSQVLLTFQNSSNEFQTFYSSRDCVELGNYAWSKTEHGFQVIYQLGEVDIQAGIPKALTVERFEELGSLFEDESDRKNFERRYSLLQYSMLRTEEERTKYLEKYPHLETQDIYILRTANATLFKRLREQLESIGYDEEELNRDQEAAGLPPEDPSVVFQVALRYELDDGQLVVTVVRELLAMPAGYYITDIAVLPYLGTEGRDSDGEILLPDGSGSVMKMNNGKTTDNAYEACVYGEDIANYDQSKRFELRGIHMPYFGILGKGSGLFAVLEESKANAVIHANVADEEAGYNYVYASFYPLSREEYQLGSAGQTSTTVYFYEKRFLKTDMSIRYFPFRGKTTYSDMAQTYRKYLEERGLLPGTSTGNSLPAYVKLTGAVVDTGNILGFSYDRMLPLTTFSQARRILEELRSGGIDELAVQYLGWNDGGLDQGLPDQIRPEKSLGGWDEFRKLISYCGDTDTDLFLRWDYQLVTKENTLFDNFVKSKHVALTITGKEGYYTTKYRPDTYIPIQWNYVLAPSLYPDFSKGLLAEMEVYGISGADIHFLSSKLAADYTESRYTSRADSIRYAQEAMETLAGSGRKILAENVSDYGLGYVTDVVPIDLSSAEYGITDYAIPFIQMVISGQIRYAGSAFNYDDPQSNLLRALETGSLLYADFTFASPDVLANKNGLDSYYTTYYRTWLDSFCQAYRTLSGVYEKVGRQLISHTRLSSNLVLAEYAQGSVLLNYSNRAQRYGDTTVEGNGYAILMTTGNGRDNGGSDE